MSEELTVIDVDGSLMDPSKVTDRTAFVARITGAGEYRKNHVEAGISQKTGEPYESFDKVILFLPVEQIYPERGDRSERELRFNLTQNEGESVLEKGQPRLNPKTAYGKLTEDAGNVGLPHPDSSEVEGNVVVISQWTESRKGFDTTRYDIIQNFGIGDFDLDEATATAESEMEGKKEVNAAF